MRLKASAAKCDSMILAKDDIKNFLPHREPFLFVDAVDEFGRRGLSATLYLDPAMPFFAGHFPGEPIMPGVLAVEALAQASGLCLALSKKAVGEEWSGGNIFYLASSNIKFVSVAKAGDTLKLKSAMTREFGGLYHFSVEASSGANVIASGSLVLASPENVKK